MPLNGYQIANLFDAIQDYDYPAKLYDFDRNQPICYETMRELESELRRGLLSDDPFEVKHALANIVYWGNIQSGYARYRVCRFLQRITETKIQKAMDLFSNLQGNSLRNIKKLRLPEFSNMSFVSKLRMFLEPGNYVTLDRKLLKLKECDVETLFHDVIEQPTYIPINGHNCEQYDRWCKKCRDAANRYFQNGEVIAVDVERGIFHLVDKGKLDKAANLVVCMP